MHLWQWRAALTGKNKTAVAVVIASQPVVTSVVFFLQIGIGNKREVLCFGICKKTRTGGLNDIKAE